MIGRKIFHFHRHIKTNRPDLKENLSVIEKKEKNMKHETFIKHKS